MRTIRWPLFLILILIVSCREDVQYGPPRYIQQQNPALIQGSYAHCAPGSECSPSVAMLVMRMGDQYGTCTAFLTDNGVLATNDHCVPKTLTAGSSCHDYIEALFPDTNSYSSDRVRCAQVLWRSGDTREHDPLVYDTAFLLLERTPNRPTLQFSHDGVDNHEIVKVYKVNPDNSPYVVSGTMESRSCRVVQKSSLYPSLDGRSSLGFMLTSPTDDSCEILSGNSGSPVVGSDGRVKGIVHHSNRATDFGRVLVEFLAIIFGQDTSAMDRPIAFATNFSCVKGPSESSYFAPSECSLAANPQYQKEMKDKNFVAAVQKLLESLNATAEQWGAENFPMFGWKMMSVQMGLILKTNTYVPVPYCTKPVGLDKPQYKGRFFGLGHRNSYQSEFILWPSFVINKSTLNDDFQDTYSFSPSRESKFMQLSFSPSEIADGKATAVSLKSQGLLTQTDLLGNKLSPCP